MTKTWVIFTWELQLSKEKELLINTLRNIGKHKTSSKQPGAIGHTNTLQVVALTLGSI
jgi:hypothetical protein